MPPHRPALSVRALGLVAFVLGAAGCAGGAASADSEIRYCGFPHQAPAFTYLPDVRARAAEPGDSLLFDWSALAESVVYHEFALRAGIEGEVPVDVVVSADGRLVASRVPEEEMPRLMGLLAPAALAATRGAPIASAPPYQTATRIVVEFRLR